MPTVTYVLPSGDRERVDLVAGTNVKDGAIDNGIDGIVGECGGSAMCATCHVYVEPGWADQLPPMRPIEHDLLEDATAPRRPTSRLACQIEVTDELDGLVVQLPDDPT